MGSAGIVLALDADWFASGALTVTFIVVIALALISLRRAGRAATDPQTATMT